MTDLAGLAAVNAANSKAVTLAGISQASLSLSYVNGSLSGGSVPGGIPAKTRNDAKPGETAEPSDQVALSSAAQKVTIEQDVARSETDIGSALAEKLRNGTADAVAVGDAFRKGFQEAGKAFADILRKLGASNADIETSLKTFLVNAKDAATETVRKGGFVAGSAGEQYSISFTDIHMQLNAGEKSVSIDYSAMAVSFTTYAVAAGTQSPVPSIKLGNGSGARIAIGASANAPSFADAVKQLQALPDGTSLPFKPLRVLGSSEESPRPMPFNLSIDLGMPLRIRFSPVQANVRLTA